MQKKHTKPSIRKRLSAIMIIGWLLPVSIIYIFMTVIYQNAIIERTENIIKENLKYVNYSISSRLDESIDISRRLSYGKNIENAWYDYQNNRITFNKLSNEIRERLNMNFNNDKRFNMSSLFLADYPDSPYYASKQEKYIELYLTSVHEEALKIAEMNTPDIFVKIIDSRVYLIRNLYTLTNYQRLGTLTLEIDKEFLFNNMNIEYLEDITIFINSSDSFTYTCGYEPHPETQETFELLKEYYDLSNHDVMTIIHAENHQAYMYESKSRDYHLGTCLILDQNEIYGVLTNLNFIIMLIFIVIIPIVGYLSHYIFKQINRPLTKVISAANRLKNGEIGVQIDETNIPNIEFEELTIAINKASSELKSMIDYAYKEELAKKDAKIMALQSQINPHFLNNTLEMMNWQARLVGDITVSKMIEALSTFLDQSMDRKNQRLIPLSEVIRCADAYFYIISMRFGKRLVTEKEVDENLLTAMIPPLILQPILENAVKHGIEKTRQGQIWLKVFRNEDNIVMQVINTGKPLTDVDLARIEKLLSKSYKVNEDEISSHHSLGIRNVNERIHLIYGEEYGLSIRPYHDDKTLSEIIIPIFCPDINIPEE